MSARALRRDLEHRLSGEVRFDLGYRALYATAAGNYRHVPVGVVTPKDVGDVLAALEVCRAHGAPLLSRGGGTGLAGQTCNEAVVLDFSKHVHGVVELDPVNRRAVVLPGTVLDDLREAAELHHLTFGPDPATHNHCTLGGMIGNNSCGVHSVMAGQTADNVEWLDVITYDGLRFTAGPASDAEIDRSTVGGGPRAALYAKLKAFAKRHEGAIRTGFPPIPRRVSGYNLPALLPENGFNVARALVGSEGTLVTVLRAGLRLVHSPPERVLLVLGYSDIFEAADHVLEVMAAKPIGLEAMDQVLLDDLKIKKEHTGALELLPEGHGWLLAEFGGDTRADAEAQARMLMANLKRRPGAPSMKVYDDPDETKRVWKVRESGLGATARIPGQPDTWEGWEDSAVPVDKLGSYLRGFRALLDRYGYRAALYGHFGQGCVHTRIPFDLKSEEGVKTFRRFVEQAADLVVQHGGSLSGEHGDGQSRAELLPKMFSPELIRAFEEFKDLFDPRGLMNPGKVVRPRRIDQDLRFGAGYRPREVTTHFKLPEDDGSFARSAERCVGIGECRRKSGGTMCPSYRATGEELHSTRGRARMLFEMMRGTLPEGWKSDAVKESLDLCLSCKGCKGDCPVNVDMATYKAEFLSHYYEGRLRPRSAYAFGLIRIWARLGSLAPKLVNAVLRAPLLGRLVKWLGGIDQRRTVPQLATTTFRAHFRERPPRNIGGPKVVLWADTFNDHFEPSVLLAACEVLEEAGLEVMLPPGGLCCGRPLYDYGMLDRAKWRLEQVLASMEDVVSAGIPIVGVEPSCVAVFRDELLSFFPDEPRALALSRLVLNFDEFIAKKLPAMKLPKLKRKALVHGHCHQKALNGMDDMRTVMLRAGLDAKVLDSGCCGMAGGFGYERGHYDVSVKSGELELLPKVRSASDEVLVVADGFSCREQVKQQTQREALHSAQVLQMALHQGVEGPRALPEKHWAHVQLPETRRRKRVEATLLAAGIGALALGLLRALRRRGAA
jgi:FAD/FMN-containing dehydrogenase/Fe-S oxidoreductase